MARNINKDKKKNEANDIEDRQISLTKTMNAPVKLVWESWTRAEHIENWWGPDGFRNTTNIMEVKTGGEWNLIMHGPDGKEYGNRSVFKDVIPYKKLVFDHISDPKSITTIELEDKGGETLLSWHMVFESSHVFQKVIKEDRAIEGLIQNIIRLDQYMQNFKN